MRRIGRCTFGALAVLMFLTGCTTGKKGAEGTRAELVTEAPEEEASETVDEALEEKPETEEKKEPSPEKEIDYAPVYAKLVRELSEEGTADQFALVYVNEDSVPELVACDSTNSWEEDEIFVYTISGEGPVLLISDIGPGMDGHEIILFEGENLIENSGAVSGDRERYLDIQDGHRRDLLEAYAVFRIEEEDPEGVEKAQFLLDGKEVTEAEYLSTLKELLSDHKKALVLTCENMLEEEVSWQDEGFFLVKDSSVRPYYSEENILRVLEGLPVEEEEPIYYVTVTGWDGFVNFRTGAGMDFGVITEIPNGETLPVYSENNEWLNVKYDNMRGWVGTSAVTKVE